ncbi:hypothetical protein N665_0095s0068 [Sinapis alba]|nr:hypothetical protein N665_0095s0068 [Sinapis alba]
MVRFAMMDCLQRFKVEGSHACKLSGQIPDQIGDLLEPVHFLSLTCHISPETYHVPSPNSKVLDLLILRRNNLSGPIPDYIGELKNITFLDLSFNQFTSGPIPGSLSQMPVLQTIKIDNNKLTGSIPNSFGSL